MANYSITVNPTSTPFTYQELSDSVRGSAEMHAKALEAQTQLEEKAAVWKRLADSTQDKEDYDRYLSYMDRINSAVENLDKYGADRSTLNDIRELRKLYKEDITPIEVGYANRAKAADAFNKMKMQNPDMIESYNPSDMSIQFYWENPDHAPELTDGSKVAARTAGILANFKQDYLNGDVEAFSLTDGEDKELVRMFQETGLRTEEALTIIANQAHAEQLQGRIGIYSKIMKRLEETTMQSLGAYDKFSNNPKAINRIKGYIWQNVPYMVGKQDNNYTGNPSYSRTYGGNTNGDEPIKFNVKPKRYKTSDDWEELAESEVFDDYGTIQKPASTSHPAKGGFGARVPNASWVVLPEQQPKTDDETTKEPYKIGFEAGVPNASWVVIPGQQPKPKKTYTKLNNAYGYLYTDGEDYDNYQEDIYNTGKSIEKANNIVEIENPIITKGDTGNTFVLNKASGSIVFDKNSVLDENGDPVESASDLEEIRKNIQEVTFGARGVEVLTSDGENYYLNNTMAEKKLALESGAVTDALLNFRKESYTKPLIKVSNNVPILKDGALTISPTEIIKLFKDNKEKISYNQGVQFLTIKDETANDIMRIAIAGNNILYSSLQDKQNNGDIIASKNLNHYYTVRGNQWLTSGLNKSPILSGAKGYEMAINPNNTNHGN